MPVGVNLTSHTKSWNLRRMIICMLKADLLNLVYEAKSEYVIFSFVGWTIIFSHVVFMTRHVWLFCYSMLKQHLYYIDLDRLADYEHEALGYRLWYSWYTGNRMQTHVTMASSEFTCIVGDLSQLSEECSYRGHQGRCSVHQWGRASNGSVLFWQGGGAAISGGKVKQETVDEGVRRRRRRKWKRRKAMMLKWSTKMKIKRMILNLSPNRMTMKGRKTEDEEVNEDEVEDKGGSSKRKKIVTSCKVVPNLHFSHFSL